MDVDFCCDGSKFFFEMGREMPSNSILSALNFLLYLCLGALETRLI